MGFHKIGCLRQGISNCQCPRNRVSQKLDVYFLGYIIKCVLKNSRNERFMSKKLTFGFLKLLTSFIVSFLFFEMSIGAMLITYAFLEIISISSKDDVAKWKSSKKYTIVLFICILGAIMILLGLKMFDNQMFIIIGGICFAPTIALIIVKDFLEYINVDRNNNKN